jgi:hypothetical protein
MAADEGFDLKSLSKNFLAEALGSSMLQCPRLATVAARSVVDVFVKRPISTRVSKERAPQNTLDEKCIP